MSMNRPIWNDGQGLTTPDLQRPCDTVGGADDRAHEVLLTPGSVAKKVLPLLEENAGSANGFTGNARILAVPSTSGLTPAGINGAVRVMPFSFVAGTAANTQQISLTGNTFSTIDTTAITSNSSGSNRYDLVYATLTRQVTTSASRRIKSAVDGSVSSQTINLADAPTITLNINAGFLTGATAPTNAQILAALPADTTTSFSVAICYVTVANGYSSGTVLAQSAITPAWPGGWVQPHRVRANDHVLSFYSGAANEKTPTILSDRWGALHRVVLVCKHLSTTANLPSSGTVLDNLIDWRQRIIVPSFFYFGSAATRLEATGARSSGQFLNSATPQIQNAFWSGAGDNSASVQAFHNSGLSAMVGLGVIPSGNLVFIGNTPIDNANGDNIVVIIDYTDQLLNGVPY